MAYDEFTNTFSDAGEFPYRPVRNENRKITANGKKHTPPLRLNRKKINQREIPIQITLQQVMAMEMRTVMVIVTVMVTVMETVPAGARLRQQPLLTAAM